MASPSTAIPMTMTDVRTARQIFWTDWGPLSEATAANRTLPRIEGTYQRYSVNVDATEICPTASTPSMGPSMYTSMRMSNRLRQIVTRARKPRSNDAPQPERIIFQDKWRRSDRLHIQVAATTTLARAAPAHAVKTNARFSPRA